MGGRPELPERYAPIRQLGEGGGGEVWLCRDSLVADRDLAVKIQLPDGDEAEFRKEYATLAALTHPNVPEIYGFGETEAGNCFFVLEFVDGVSFAEAVQQEGIDRFPSLAAEALQALSFIHDFGLLHRDLKPQNLLVRRRPKSDCRVVMLDFGLAESRRNPTVETAGTLRYMAPELFEGAVSGVRTDLYALGVVFLEALCGRFPIREDPRLDLTSYLCAAKRPVDRRLLPDSLSPGLATWLNALRSYESTERPSDAREALAQLKTIAGGEIGTETATIRAAQINSGVPPGRSGELAAIKDALLDPGTAAVIITGEAGSGKTRLLEAVRGDAIRNGWSVVTPTIRAGASIGDPMQGGSERTRLLLLDELETAGPETGALLDRAVRNPSPSRKVLACGRSEEISDVTVKAILSDAGFIPTVVHFELVPLDGVGVADVLKRVFGGEPSAARVEQVLAATNGLAAAVEAYVVSDDEGAARLSGRLEQSVQARLNSLSELQAKCAVALAVLAEPTSIHVLAKILETTGESLASILERLRATKLIREVDNSWVVQSRLVSELLVDLIDSETVTQITRRAIRVVEETPGADQPSQLARLWRRLGSKDKAVEHSIHAARQALGNESYKAAKHWLRLAILDLPRDDTRYADLRREHAEVCELAADYRAAAKGHLAVARSSEDESQRVLGLILAARAFLKAGLPTISLQAAKRASACAKSEQQRALAAWQLGAAYNVNGEPGRAYELLKPLPPRIDEMGQPKWAAEARLQIAVALDKQRRLDAASDAYLESARYASENGCTEVLINTLISHAKTEYNRADPDQALRYLERARKLAAESGLERQISWVLGHTARVLQFKGAFDKASQHYEEVITRSRLFGNHEQYFTAQGIQAEILIKLGRPAQATERLQGVLEMSPGEPTSTFIALTLSEALLEEPDPDASEIYDLLQRVEREKARSPLIDWGQIVVSLEYHARFGTGPSEELWQRFQDSLTQEGLDQTLVARGWLAWSKEKARKSDWRSALDACAKAIEALGGRHHDLAAQAFLSMSKAHELRGGRVEANLALDRARGELAIAADLIEDEDLRNDFLARPVFKALRMQRRTFADAAERLAALYEMVRALNTETDPEGQIGVILDQALRVVRAERGLILLRSEGDDTYRVRFARNLESDTVEDAARFSRTAVLAAGRGEPVLAINAANDARVAQMKSVSAYGIKSLLCVPLRVRDELVGAVYADSRADGALFQEQDLKFLAAFADHAALALENARDLRRLEKRRAQLVSAIQSREALGAIVGRSAAMQKVYDLIERVAESHLPVLIQGDSGTGKELVAREIFARSLRKDQTFLSENCAAITESLLESELFGHVKGAFTGADRDKAGLFELADGGTLFLDEVGDMSPAMQARLLRVLQDGGLRRVGAEKSRRVDVRLITATHRDLAQRVADGDFREDLLYRLQVLVIQLPPLSERPTDIELLVHHFLDRIAAERQQKKAAIRTDVMELLERYAWPGNVRQLENTLQRLVLLAGGKAISRETIEQDPSLQAALIGQAGKPTLSLKQNERDRIVEALERAGGNRADAARLLGVSRATIFRKIKGYGLS